MQISLPSAEANDTLSHITSAFASVIDFIRKLYYLIYNVISNIVGNPTKTV